MRGQEQQPALFAPRVACPFGEPFDQIGHGDRLVRDLARKPGDTLGDQVDPAVARLPVQQVEQIPDRKPCGRILP